MNIKTILSDVETRETTSLFYVLNACNHIKYGAYTVIIDGYIVYACTLFNTLYPILNARW